ncbi:hypothetical protein ASPFODRAFT_55496 [Aspergillus luchuensis CBS 106.47]|uniref:Uncharacterized protein n=1 Tax=Aspergillus luchuensis (strain CBS 106.47) TaxID=1137211 RepID=A0A1M3TYP2_ASPLC|nr:hypothetical protein ASPFODRAFT_55496 [Aspergillus luchuensis CBS 106.47]
MGRFGRSRQLSQHPIGWHHGCFAYGNWQYGCLAAPGWASGFDTAVPGVSVRVSPPSGGGRIVLRPPEINPQKSGLVREAASQDGSDHHGIRDRLGKIPGLGTDMPMDGKIASAGGEREESEGVVGGLQSNLGKAREGVPSSLKEEVGRQSCHKGKEGKEWQGRKKRLTAKVRNFSAIRPDKLSSQPRSVPEFVRKLSGFEDEGEIRITTVRSRPNKAKRKEQK